MNSFDRRSMDRVELAELCVGYGLRELSAFGSILREDLDEESDVDLLVEFDPELRPCLFALIRLQHQLEDLLGRKADLVPKEGLKLLLRDEVLASARRIYAA